VWLRRTTPKYDLLRIFAKWSITGCLGEGKLEVNENV